MPVVFVGIGSSLGDRIRNLRNAVVRLNAIGSETEVVKVSSIYESPHLGIRPGDDQKYPEHLNAVLTLMTALAPYDLLTKLHKTENEGQRDRTERWGPRTIDLDILLYDNLEIETDLLVIPHPGIPYRAFVLLPLAELEPGLELPNGQNIQGLLNSPVILAQQIERVGSADELFL